jgi:protein TonB
VTSEPNRGSPPAPRIVDLVFDVSSVRQRPMVLFALLLAIGLHAALWLWARGSSQSLESWSAELALRVHAELSRDELVELAKPPPPPAPQPETPAPPEPAAPALHRSAHSPAQEPQAPAQASAIIARAPDPSAPIDLTGETFVTGSANAYAGGVTASSGTSKKAVLVREVAPAPAKKQAPSAPDQSSAVALEDQAWRCPWPGTVETDSIDEQTVVLRVVVRPDGSVESARIVKDPGQGFAPAALACALRTRFSPAKDRDGRPMRAASPPIRVRFTR